MCRLPYLLPFAVVGWLLVSPPQRARAECICADSIEWLIASSDTIVRGRITDVVCDKVTVRVAETLKGEKQKTVHFEMRQGLAKVPDGQASAHLEKGETDLLIFLVRGDEPKIIFLSSGYPLKVPTMDFKVLTRPGEVLDAVRASPRAVPGRSKAKSATLWVPLDFEAKWWQEGVVIRVPVDGRLEARAKEWLQSKDFQYRHLGVVALGKFKSEANIRLMRALLQSPESEEKRTGDRRARHYPLRRTAYDILEKWGVKVPEPVTEEPLDRPRDPAAGCTDR